MKKIIERIFIEMIKKIGFETASRNAVELFSSVFEDRIEAVLLAGRSRSLHARRPTATLIDVIESIYYVSSFYAGKKSNVLKYRMTQFDIELYGKNLNFSEYDDIKVFLSRRRNGLFLLPRTENNAYEIEKKPEIKEWVSPLGTKVEKFIHIYDFMPSFPPVYTFRHTISKQKNNNDQSTKVKNRLEQSLFCEENMIKLIKKSKTLPPFINYLYKQNKNKTY